ncbi:MAG: class II aldolase/adducin family protein [Candidatus Krumholzibacteria bacterium]|nr:class II aldolase/adducin family protein [Candidatus Krumholzibacteria bacterium]
MSASRPNLVVLRREMVGIGRLMYEKNLIVAGEGNLSVRLGGHSFLVTPAGTNKGDLRVQDLLETDIQGRSAQGTATSEWPLHKQIYELRSDVRAICHAHAPWATAFAAAGRDLDGSLLTETATLFPRVPLAARALPGSDALAASIIPFIADHDAVLLGNHGVVTVGKDLHTAFSLLETVERLAQVTLLAEAASGTGHSPE